MTLADGTRLGFYEIVSPLGKGGMGEVYRARDTRLERDVAIKVLPEELAADGERVARFEREARLLASLNHPNIASIHGLEESEGVKALVLELVEGPTLAERIEQGPIPVDEAIAIARQVAEALEAGHEAGVIHRDLKPANIKLKEDGTVKVLDYGLAKALEVDAPSGADSALSQSPTLTRRGTQVGVILGTAAYMSPEQARGKRVDKRTDIWAFGAVLYEMLTGTRAFRGDDVSETLASVLKDAPPMEALPATTPGQLRHLLARCLDRDLRNRLRDIGEARVALTQYGSGGTDLSMVPSPGAVPATGRRRELKLLVLAALGGVAAASVGAWLMARAPIGPKAGPIRLSVVPSASLPLARNLFDRNIAISPDGTRIAYLAGSGTESRLMVRDIGRLDAELVSDLDPVRSPFFSPNGEWVGFYHRGELKKVSVSGGPAVTLCPIVGAPRGADWTEHGTIIFATGDESTGLFEVADTGGEPTAITTPDRARGEIDHWQPSLLPGGRTVLFAITHVDHAGVAVVDLSSGKLQTLVRGGTQPRYVDPGMLLYASGGSLHAVRFDLQSLTIRGEPVPVLERVAMSPTTGAADYAVSSTGTLVYAPGGASASARPRSLAWVDRTGREERINAPPRAYEFVRLSPDGDRLALSASDQEEDVWVFHLGRETLTRLTFDPGADSRPLWTPDGRGIVYASEQGGNRNLFRVAADGTGSPERLTTSDHSQTPSSFSPDGARLLFMNRGTSADIFILNMADRTVSSLIETREPERNAEISPDGRWVAYESWEGGPPRIFVRPFPDIDGGRWQIATSGVMGPVWAPDGRELFFRSADGIEGVTIQTAPAFAWSNPSRFVGFQPIEPQPEDRRYDISRDGKRFVVIQDPPPSPDEVAARKNLIVVLGWLEELERLLPSDS